jgi:hypothetical protein
MRPYRLVIALISLLAGCTNLLVMSTVPLSTVARLSSLKPADIDVALLRVAARLPVSLQPAPRGATVTIARVAAENRPALEEAFILDAVPAAQEIDAIAGHARAGARVWIFKLSPRDIERFRRAIAPIVEGTVRPGVTISAAVDACHRSALTGEQLLTTTWLRTNGTGYFVLAEDLDLRKVMSEQDLTIKIPACAE